jgi:SAM-dependent methyltransferase
MASTAPEAPPLEFWRSRYQSGQMGWDLGEASAPARELTARLAPGSRVFIPGCGLGYEALLLAAQGHAVCAVDFAPEAVERLRAQAVAQGVRLEVLHQDIFALPARYDGSFDAVLEQACLGALGPSRFAPYEQLAWRVLKPGGRLLGVFMEVQGLGPPPYSLPLPVVQRLFAPPRWQLAETRPVVPRNPKRPGPEYTVVFSRA